MILADSPGSSFAGIITALSTIITAIGGVVLAVGVLVPLLRTSRATLVQTEKVHVLVNQSQTDAKRYQVALLAVLAEHGITPPVDQSLPVIGQPDADRGTAPP